MTSEWLASWGIVAAVLFLARPDSTGWLLVPAARRSLPTDCPVHDVTGWRLLGRSATALPRVSGFFSLLPVWFRAEPPMTRPGSILRGRLGEIICWAIADGLSTIRVALHDARTTYSRNQSQTRITVGRSVLRHIGRIARSRRSGCRSILCEVC